MLFAVLPLSAVSADTGITIRVFDDGTLEIETSPDFWDNYWYQGGYYYDQGIALAYEIDEANIRVYAPQGWRYEIVRRYDTFGPITANIIFVPPWADTMLTIEIFDYFDWESTTSHDFWDYHWYDFGTIGTIDEYNMAIWFCSELHISDIQIIAPQGWRYRFVIEYDEFWNMFIKAIFYSPSTQSFIVPNLEWSGLEITIYPAPIEISSQTGSEDWGLDYESFDIFVVPGTVVTVEVVGVPLYDEYASMLQMGGFTAWGDGDNGWGNEWVGDPIFTLPAPWVANFTGGALAWQGFPSNALDLNSITITYRGGWRTIVNLYFAEETEISIDDDFYVYYAVDTDANTITFEIESIIVGTPTDYTVVYIFVAQFNGDGQFIGMKRTPVTIPSGASATETVEFDMNSRIMIWEFESQTPIINTIRGSDL